MAAIAQVKSLVFDVGNRVPETPTWTGGAIQGRLTSMLGTRSEYGIVNIAALVEAV